MRKEKKLYLRMPDQYIRKNLDDLCLGYANALESVGLIPHDLIDGVPFEVFQNSRYCHEDLMTFRRVCGGNRAYAIGWIIGKAYCKEKRGNTPRTLADICRAEEKLQYRLKDRALERTLDQASDPDFPLFSEKLDAAMKRRKPGEDIPIWIEHTYGNGYDSLGRTNLRFNLEEIEEVKE